MKTTNHIGGGEVQLATDTVIRMVNELPAGRDAFTSGPKTEVRRGFPMRLLATALLLTAVTVVWTSWNPAQLPVTQFKLSVIVSLGLCCAAVVAWFGTARAVFRCQRDYLQNTLAAGEKERLSHEHELLRTIVDNLPDCIYAKDREGRFVLNNTAHAKKLGVSSPKELVGKSDFDFCPPEVAAQFYADEQAIIQSGRPVLNQEQYKVVHGEGGGVKRWGSVSKVLWRDAQGGILGTVGITRDIHESKLAQEALRRSEEKLRQFTIQLERSNSELQDFAYVASHDLQEPLRKIVVFGERLKEKCGDTLPPEGRDYLERMEKAALRMQILINDLLTFSRVTTKAQSFVRVDLAEVAREVVDDLEARIEQVKGRVELGSLPVIDADPLQMRQLLQNLIGNALKFRRPEEPPVVKVEARIVSGPRPRAGAGAPDERLSQLMVTDNGIGFDEKYLDRIFNVFQRLHTRKEYEGTGMGLAIARKIVSHHGGEITAKSKPGQGSAFIVTMPVSRPRQDSL